MSPKQKWLTVSALTAFWVTTVPATYLIGASILRPRNLSVEHYYYSTPLIGGGDDTEPRFDEENPIVYIDVPRVIKMSDTITIEAKLEESLPSVARLNGVKETTLTYSAGATSPSIEIAPSAGMIPKTGVGLVEWQWLAKAKEAGEHSIRLQFDKDIISVRSVDYLKNENRLDPSMRVTNDSVVCNVRVLTALGLTAGQDAWLRAIGPAFALLCTLFGYPVWKKHLEKGSAKQWEPISVIFQKGAITTVGDTYNVDRSQVGALGSKAHAHEMEFSQTIPNHAAFDLAVLHPQLAQLRQRLQLEAVENPQLAAVAAVANAEHAAGEGDSDSTMRFLSKAGQWAFDVATKIGVSVAAEAIKTASGLK